MNPIPAALKAHPIALVGMMGVGKTTVGRRLAAHLGLPFFDSDEEIERASGRTVKGYFRDHGVEAFRDGERKVIERLLSGPPCVLATGGGAFVQEPTRNILNANATTVWLRAEHAVIFKRVRKRNTRPLLDVSDPSGALHKLIEERYPIYALAEITVDCNTGPHKRTVDAIVSALLAHSGAIVPQGAK